jgi:Ca2+-binding EF-hand superfamily protein
MGVGMARRIYSMRTPRQLSVPSPIEMGGAALDMDEPDWSPEMSVLAPGEAAAIQEKIRRKQFEAARDATATPSARKKALGGWKRAKFGVAEQLSPKAGGTTSPLSVTKAVKKFSAVLDKQAQVARVAAHLIGTLRDIAASNRGYIDRETFRAVLQELGTMKAAHFGDALSDDLFDVIDQDRNGKLAEKELERAILDLVDPDYCSDVEGLLSLGNNVMRTSIRQMTDSLSAQAGKVIDLFKEWDANGDGACDRSQFARLPPPLPACSVVSLERIQPSRRA